VLTHGPILALSVLYFSYGSCESCFCKLKFIYSELRMMWYWKWSPVKSLDIWICAGWSGLLRTSGM